jgi:hypothetical protein
MPALSPVKRERVGLGGSRVGTKENKISKAGRLCSWECYEKKLKYTVIQKYFFPEILINVKAGRLNTAPGKYIAGAALDRPDLQYFLLSQGIGVVAYARAPPPRFPELPSLPGSSSNANFLVHSRRRQAILERLRT